MTASLYSRLATGAVFAVSLLMVDIAQPTYAQAQTVSPATNVSGSFRNYRVKRGYGNHRSVRNRGVRRSNVRRSGVILGSQFRRSGYYNSVNQRRRLIEERNRRVVLENQLRRSGTSGIQLLDDGFQRGVIVNGEATSSGTQVIYQRSTRYQCPAGHNCGYRLYQDGTGPRIISPGGGVGGNLPAYDGVSGPTIITLD